MGPLPARMVSLAVDESPSLSLSLVLTVRSITSTGVPTSLHICLQHQICARAPNAAFSTFPHFLISSFLHFLFPISHFRVPSFRATLLTGYGHISCHMMIKWITQRQRIFYVDAGMASSSWHQHVINFKCNQYTHCHWPFLLHSDKHKLMHFSVVQYLVTALFTCPSSSCGSSTVLPLITDLNLWDANYHCTCDRKITCSHGIKCWLFSCRQLDRTW